jgi:G3E family GTPase
MEQLLKLKKFDHVIVECSGAADPAPLIELLWVDEELDVGVRLDAVVCVIDAFNFDRLVSEQFDTVSSVY